MIERLYLNVGQMKSGTTFLYGILRNHPSIYFTPEKELHYLSQCYGRFKLLSEPVRLRKAYSLVEKARNSKFDGNQYQAFLRWVAD